MKKFILFAALTCLLAFNPSNALRAENFKGAYEMFMQEDINDLFILSAVTQRCSGVYGAMGKYLPSSDSQLAQLKETSVLMSTLYFEKSVELLNQKGQNTPTANLKQIDKAIRYFVDFYYNQLEISQQRTGSIFSDWVQQEFSFCNQLREKLF